MPRVVFAKGEQSEYLRAVKQAMQSRAEKLALDCGVHPRTVRDWQREKYLISQEAVTTLQKISGIPCPRILEILPDYWSTKKAGQKGGKHRLERYGNPGTADGRRRGGLISYKKMKESECPTGFTFRKTSAKPKPSALFAEFLGIMLGDGGAGTKYEHACLCFRNYSQPLLDSFCHILKNLGYHPTMGHNRIYLYRQKEIKRYFDEVGTHNPKHFKRYETITDSSHKAPVE